MLKKLNNNWLISYFESRLIYAKTPEPEKNEILSQLTSSLNELNQKIDQESLTDEQKIELEKQMQTITYLMKQIRSGVQLSNVLEEFNSLMEEVATSKIEVPALTVSSVNSLQSLQTESNQVEKIKSQMENDWETLEFLGARIQELGWEIAKLKIQQEKEPKETDHYVFLTDFIDQKNAELERIIDQYDDLQQIIDWNALVEEVLQAEETKNEAISPNPSLEFKSQSDSTWVMPQHPYGEYTPNLALNWEDEETELNFVDPKYISSHVLSWEDKETDLNQEKSVKNEFAQKILSMNLTLSDEDYKALAEQAQTNDSKTLFDTISPQKANAPVDSNIAISIKSSEKNWEVALDEELQLNQELSWKIAEFTNLFKKLSSQEKKSLIGQIIKMMKDEELSIILELEGTITSQILGRIEKAKEYFPEQKGKIPLTPLEQIYLSANLNDKNSYADNLLRITKEFLSVSNEVVSQPVKKTFFGKIKSFFGFAKKEEKPITGEVKESEELESQTVEKNWSNGWPKEMFISLKPEEAKEKKQPSILESSSETEEAGLETEAVEWGESPIIEAEPTLETEISENKKESKSESNPHIEQLKIKLDKIYDEAHQKLRDELLTKPREGEVKESEELESQTVGKNWNNGLPEGMFVSLKPVGEQEKKQPLLLEFSSEIKEASPETEVIEWGESPIIEEEVKSSQTSPEVFEIEDSKSYWIVSAEGTSTKNVISEFEEKDEIISDQISPEAVVLAEVQEWKTDTSEPIKQAENVDYALEAGKAFQALNKLTKGTSEYEDWKGKWIELKAQVLKKETIESKQSEINQFKDKIKAINEAVQKQSRDLKRERLLETNDENFMKLVTSKEIDKGLEDLVSLYEAEILKKEKEKTVLAQKPVEFFYQRDYIEGAINKFKAEIKALDRAIGSGEVFNKYADKTEAKDGFDKYDFTNPQKWAENEILKREAKIKELEILLN